MTKTYEISGQFQKNIFNCTAIFGNSVRCQFVLNLEIVNIDRGERCNVNSNDAITVMAYNEKLTNRIREALAHLPGVEEKKMFRGVAFMVDGKLCISAGDDEMMCRIDPVIHGDVIKRKGRRAVIMKGREYKGYVYVKENSI